MSRTILKRGEELVPSHLAEIETIYRSAPLGMCVLNSSLRYVRINKKLAEINGIPSEDHIGKTIRDIVPDLADSAENLSKRIFATGKPEINIDFSGVTAGQPGVERYWTAHALPLKTTSGEVIGISVVVEEITEHKRMKQDLMQSSQRMRAALDAYGGAIYDHRVPLDKSTYHDDRWAELLGYHPDELPSYEGFIDWLYEQVHPEDRDKLEKVYGDFVEGRIPGYHIEIRIRHKLGHWIWVEGYSNAVERDEKGRVRHIVGVMTDITARKKMEEALQKAHCMLEEKVKDRTFQLVQINERLKLEIEERKTTAENLQNALIEIQVLKDRLEAEKAYLQEEIKSEYNYENIIGNSKVLRYALYKVEQIAPTDTTVIILGETGTGKELIARAIHDSGPRRHRAFVKVNCATLPSNLMESELFGHEKGAFSGAIAKRLGRFEVADGATLFLDEIGELPLSLQAKLLSVLQDGEFERVGSSQTVKVDVRIIAATNRDLKAEVSSGRFRQDLWFRLNVFPITMPPLRKRKEDIPTLAEFFVEKVSKKLGESIDVIPKGVMDTLQNYHWPGNIRELQNVIERAVINASENKLRLMDKLEPSQKDVPKIPKTIEKVEHDHIVRILEETGWKVAGKKGAAGILGINPSTLRARMRKLGIKKPKTSLF